MPKILIVGDVTFFIYSGDIDEKRLHIHVEKKKGRYRKAAKFWLEPEIELVTRGNLSDKEINEVNEVKKIIQMNHVNLVKQIRNFYNGLEIRTIRIK